MECYNKIRITNNTKLLARFPEGIEVDCGKCLNCLANKAINKALRVLHEAETKDEKGDKIYKVNFLTFTYSDDSENINLIKNDKNVLTVQKQKVRKIRDKIYSRFYRKNKELAKSYKYMIAGEYGENGTLRPHYHMVILTSKKHSKVLHEFIKEFKGGRYDLQKDVSAKAIFYVAGYTAKKIGSQAYRDDIEEPFLICSKGLGKEWLKQNARMLQERGYIALYGKKGEIKIKIPRTYLNWINKYNLWTKEELEEYIEEKIKVVKELEKKKMNEVLGEYHFRLTGRVFSKYDMIGTYKQVEDRFIYDKNTNKSHNHYTSGFYLHYNKDKIGYWVFKNSKWTDYKIKREQMLQRKAEKRLKENITKRCTNYVVYD